MSDRAGCANSSVQVVIAYIIVYIITQCDLRNGRLSYGYIGGLRTINALKPSSHRRHGQDKTVLSCLVCVGDVNRIGDKSRLSATENFESVLSTFEMR